MAQIRPAKDPSNQTGLGCLIPFTLLWTAFTIPFFLFAILGQTEDAPDRACVILFMLPFLGVDCLLVYVCVRSIRMRVAQERYLLPAEVRLDPPSVRLDEDFEFQYLL